MAAAAATTAVRTTAPAITVFRRLGLVSSLVVLDGGCAGSAVVGPVARFMFASVVWGRMPVAVSLATEPEPSLAVPASGSIDD